jgi:hypothetical protein
MTSLCFVGLTKPSCRFYVEVAPKPNQSRAKQMAAEQANEYTKNSFKSIHSAINRHFQDLGRDDLVLERPQHKIFPIFGQGLSMKCLQNL